MSSTVTLLKSMSIADIMEQYPQSRAVFQQFGLHTYAVTETAKYENLQASALVHSVNLDTLLEALTNAIEGR